MDSLAKPPAGNSPAAYPMTPQQSILQGSHRIRINRKINKQKHRMSQMLTRQNLNSASEYFAMKE
ncbi:MAG: hypothetical protein EA366_08755 [Spirulina sp. DLM2.Bin59]|nr:MAG: hypothetical protein EA366_08755 [Spirulina sp. DLM2.Bin59]